MWPSDINVIPKTSAAWLSGLDNQDKHEDPTVFANPYNGMRPMRSSLQMHRLPGNYSGVLITNHSIPQPLRRIVTSRSKNPNPGPTLSFHNIEYTVRRQRCKFFGSPEPYPILKGIRYDHVCNIVMTT